MSDSCSDGSCQCAEKDKQILQFKSQIDRLQSKKLMLQATNVHLREQLDDCTRELEARLTFKEDEVQALRGTCKAMSSHVLDSQEKTVALQEELVKKEQLLRVTSPNSSSLYWPPDEPPSLDSPRSEPLRSPRSTHSISIQTSPRREEAERTVSCTSEDLCSLSPRSETSPSLAEVQELRYTVQVLKEQLEELHSTPASPSHAASPKRTPCASLADMLEFTNKLRLLLPLDGRSSSGCTSPAQLSPMNKTRTPADNQSNPSVSESCQNPSTLECEVLHTLLVSELHTAEGIARQAISLERDGALREVSMMHDWFLTQYQLLLGGLQQLQRLEDCERDHLQEAESNFRKNLYSETHERPLQPVSTCRLSHAPLDDVGLGVALEPHTLACETMGRTAIVLEEECGRQALTMFGDWHRAQSKLRVAATRQLTTLEGTERGRISQDEETSRGVLLQEEFERPQTPQVTSSMASSVGDDFSSTLTMEELQEPWALRDHLCTTSADGSHTPLSSSKSFDWSHTPLQSLVGRQQRAFKLLVQHEGNEWARLVWLSEVELTRRVYNALLQIQLSCGRLAEDIEVEEKVARSLLKELFEEELLECLKCIEKRKCGLRVYSVWENERWTPVTGWGKTLLGRPSFSDVTGKVVLDMSLFDSIIARERLCWSSEGWELDISSSVDLDGWQYALTFDTPFRPTPWPLALVRRRKWVRVCEPLPAAKPADASCESPTTPASSSSSMNSGSRGTPVSPDRYSEALPQLAG